MAIVLHVENANGPTAISENPFHVKMYPATTEEVPVLGKKGNVPSYYRRSSQFRESGLRGRSKSGLGEHAFPKLEMRTKQKWVR